MNEERPAEEASAIALRDQVAAFHAGAADRAQLALEDRSALEAMATQAKLYCDAALTAWRSIEEWASDALPPKVLLVPSIIDEYINTTMATVTLSLTSGRTLEAPSIESATVRGVLVRQGEAAIAAINDAIACGYARVAQVADAKARAEAGARYWLGVPVVRALCVALAAVVDASADIEESFYNVGGLLETLKQVQIRYKGRHPEAPEPLYVHVGVWRRWLPTVRRVLAETAGGAA